ncbi:MAG: hypothetical protein P4L41_09815 [Flavipsychrobacter sp.]|nr:hypothetical protein [Flavipsychrobacter sp.]
MNLRSLNNPPNNYQHRLVSVGMGYIAFFLKIVVVHISLLSRRYQFICSNILQSGIRSIKAVKRALTNNFVLTYKPMAVSQAFSHDSQLTIRSKIIMPGIASLNYFRIFNRWGALIFSIASPHKGSYRKYNGTPQLLGAYGFITLNSDRNTRGEIY